MDVKTKTCSKCGERKPRDAFYKDKSRKDGLTPQCKACNAEYRANNKEQKREYQRKTWPRNLRSYAKYRVRKLPKYLRQPVLSAEQIEALDTGRCAYTDKPIDYGKHAHDPDGRSLDKIIPELQYLAGNCLLVSYRVNAIKYNSSNPSELERVARWIEKMLSGEIELPRRPEGVEPTGQERRIFWSKRGRVKKKGLPFNLMIDDIYIPDRCPALGIPFKKGKGPQCDNSPSLDQLVPGEGYVRGNVAVISDRANRIKSDASPDELRLIAKNMRAYVNAAYRLSDELCWLMDGCDESDAERAARLHLDVAQFAWLY